MAAKEKSDIVYALADYKQLVVAYKTKYSLMVRQVTFWKTCVVWLVFIISIVVVAAAAGFFDYTGRLSSRQKNIFSLEEQVQDLSFRLDTAQSQLQKVRFELAQKEEAIKQMEKNSSTASKKLLEKLLKDQEPREPR
jgi:septal ring factor EnvC (AmiA/AmiB activator)